MIKNFFLRSGLRAMIWSGCIFGIALWCSACALDWSALSTTNDTSPSTLATNSDSTDDTHADTATQSQIESDTSQETTTATDSNSATATVDTNDTTETQTSETTETSEVPDTGTGSASDTGTGSEPEPFRLDRPAANEHYYRNQPVIFSGYTPDTLEVRLGTTTLFTVDGPGAFTHRHAFATTGNKSLTFRVGGKSIGGITLVIDENFAIVCIDPVNPFVETTESKLLYPAIINRKVGYYLADKLAELGIASVFTVSDISREEIFDAGFNNEGASEQSQLVATDQTARASICNTAGSDYVISIHHNQTTDTNINYTRVLWGAVEGMPTVPRYDSADDWAMATAQYLTSALGTSYGEAQSDLQFGTSIKILQNISVPGIITLGSFISNPVERSELNTNSYLEDEAEAIRDAFAATYASSFPTSR